MILWAKRTAILQNEQRGGRGGGRENQQGVSSVAFSSHSRDTITSRAPLCFSFSTHARCHGYIMVFSWFLVLSRLRSVVLPLTSKLLRKRTVKVIALLPEPKA